MYRVVSRFDDLTYVLIRSGGGPVFSVTGSAIAFEHRTQAFRALADWSDAVGAEKVPDYDALAELLANARVEAV